MDLLITTLDDQLAQGLFYHTANCRDMLTPVYFSDISALDTSAWYPPADIEGRQAILAGRQPRGHGNWKMCAGAVSTTGGAAAAITRLCMSLQHTMYSIAIEQDSLASVTFMVDGPADRITCVCRLN